MGVKHQSKHALPSVSFLKHLVIAGPAFGKPSQRRVVVREMIIGANRLQVIHSEEFFKLQTVLSSIMNNTKRKRPNIKAINN